VQSEPGVPTEVSALAGVWHLTKHQFSILEDGLDPGDPR
jgi:hypothetical protein